MEGLNYFKYTTQLLIQSLQYAKNSEAEKTDLERWINLSDKAMESLEELIYSPKLNQGEKRTANSLLINILSIQNNLKNLMEKSGGELQEPSTSLKLNEIEKKSVEWNEMPSAFKKRIRSGIITNLQHKDALSFMNDAESLFESKITSALDQYGAIKVSTELVGEYTLNKNDVKTVEVKYFNTKSIPIYKSTELTSWFEDNVKQPILVQMEEFEQKDSGWSLQQILSLIININKFNPMKGSTYIKLPDQIEQRKACVNICNNDNKCFMWAILSALYPQKSNPHRVSHYYQYENELNFDGLDFPICVKQIQKFEKQNTVSINLYILKKHGSNFSVSPCHISSHKKEKHVNLLLIQDYYIDENEEDREEEKEEQVNSSPPKFHYVWIKHLSRLVRGQLTNCKKKCFVCDRCLNFFMSEENLKKHEMDCRQLNKCKIQLPMPDKNILKFKNFHFKEKVPFIIYADFECILKPIENAGFNETRKSYAYQQHCAYSIGYYFKSSLNNYQSVYESYRQKHHLDVTPAEWFVQKLQNIANDLDDALKNIKPMNLSDAETNNFMQAKFCHICKKIFKVNEKKVRDHCHFTGSYRGAAHESCNLNYKDSRSIPIIFHNLSGYDSQFIIKDIARAEHFKGRISLIAENKEKYISFCKHIDGSNINFKFIDSFRFMPSSLEKLASYLESLSITSNVFHQSGYTTDQIQLLLRKGVFPYDYVSSLDTLEECNLPTKENFYSKLYENEISDSEYEHAQNVWNTFDIKSLGDYSDLYLKTDVLLLADVFENFRSTCLEAYELDPAHYYTTPGLTWDAMLKCTQVELELLTDIDMLLFVEKGIRGGISQCCNRYAKANNKYMLNDYNPEEEEKYLMYFDANNLYGWAMTQYLPSGGFQWVENLDSLNFFNVSDDHCYGYILEVDLEYPWTIHDKHKDLPFCPDHATPPGSKQKKLLTTLYNKQRYVIHYRALKQALQHGLILRKVYRALRFNQSAWLKSYVDLNTEKRKQSRNEFEKLFFKLIINAVYGKTMENERKRVDVKLVNKWDGRYSAETLIAKPNFHSCSIFDENLVAIQLLRTDITIKKPIYIGLSVLDISKTLIYDFHYSYMKKEFTEKCKLLYTDTDSLIYEICGTNVYEVMKRDINKFDTSDYPENNQYGIPLKNKKVIGLMKDECCGNIMLEFIGLRSKMYCIRIQNEKNREIRKAKGVKTCVVKTKITFKDYWDCLFNNIKVTCEQNNIRSKLHTVYTERQSKIALSPFDDKRYLLAGETDTLPWGHKSVLDDDDKLLLYALLKFESAEEREKTSGGSQDSRVGEIVETGVHKEQIATTDISQTDLEEEEGEPYCKRPKL